MSSGNILTHSNLTLSFTSGGISSKTRSATDPQRRVLDELTRLRRHQRHLEALEKDNYHDDPHASFAHLLNKAKLPSFSDGTESKQVT